MIARPGFPRSAHTRAAIPEQLVGPLILVPASELAI
jgi:hypothetical protein